jgi:Ca2+-binding RTX toxin-like protein
MKRTTRPALEALETRNLMSNAWLANGVLTIQGDLNSANSAHVSQSTMGGQTTTQVALDGKNYSFKAPVSRIVYHGGNAGDTYTDTTSLNASVTAGNGNNYVTVGNGSDAIRLGNGANNVHTGSGHDSITVGSGANVIYDLAGSGSVTLGAHSSATADHVITRYGTMVSGAQAGDVVVSYGAPGRQPGAGNVVLSNGVLYLTASNMGENFDVRQVGNNLVVTYSLNNGTGSHTATFSASAVRFIAGLGGAGNDNFINETAVGDSFVAGATSCDIICGGRGFNLLVGGSGGGVVQGLGTYNDLSSLGNCIMVGSNGLGADVIRCGATDTTMWTSALDKLIMM